MPISKPLQAGGSNHLVSTIYNTLFKKWRVKRMADFERLLQPRPGERILDVGGCKETWEHAQFQGCAVDLININIYGAFEPSTVINLSPCCRLFSCLSSERSDSYFYENSLGNS